MALICKNGVPSGRLEMSPQSDVDRFFTLAEVRQKLGVSRSTLWRWIAERGLLAVRIGGVTRIRERDLEAFLARHESNPQAEPVARGGDCVHGPPAR